MHDVRSRSQRRHPAYSCRPRRRHYAGLGRALGETMAVTFVIGNAHKISPSLIAPGTTISATIANEFTEAVGDLYTSSLILLGLILFAITLIVLAFARLMLLRLENNRGAKPMSGPLPLTCAATTSAAAAMGS